MVGKADTRVRFQKNKAGVWPVPFLGRLSKTGKGRWPDWDEKKRRQASEAERGRCNWTGPERKAKEERTTKRGRGPKRRGKEKKEKGQKMRKRGKGGE